LYETASRVFRAGSVLAPVGRTLLV